MRYIGNKLNLLEFIYSVIRENNILKGVFCDIFAGTANVSKFFKKKGFKIISNDFMTYSYVFERAYICNNNMPNFSELSNEIKNPDIFKIINYLNELSGKEGFIFKNYCKEGSKNLEFVRNYFSEENAKKIDSIRDKIEEWKINKKINEDEYYILLCSLLEVVPSVSNVAGTYGAFMKINDPRMFKPLILEVPTLIESDLNHECYKEDSNKLIKEITCDILYLDPPYNNRQYATNYHLLETIAVWDKKIMNNKTGLRPYETQKSNYCYNSKCVKVFEELIKNAKCKFILLSYNNEGIISHEEIIKILKNKGELKIYTEDYRRYKSNSNGNHNKKQLKEYLFFVKVKN
jgi:adenine-specific DNA-methyltransferase